ncbi:MAG: prepilin-type N-terminal cleavage/methylation domain-containing protein [Planctomycetota bacterium]
MHPRPAPTPVPARGLTLVELMIVVVIVGIAAALAVPLFSDTDDVKLRAAATVLAADLDAARIESIAHADDPRVVVFNTVTETYHVAAASAPTTPLPNPGGGGSWLITFGQGAAVSLTGVGLHAVSVGGDDTLAYAAFGHLDESADAAIELEAGGMRIVITVDAATGEATVGTLLTP